MSCTSSTCPSSADSALGPSQSGFLIASTLDHSFLSEWQLAEARAHNGSGSHCFPSSSCHSGCSLLLFFFVKTVLCPLSLLMDLNLFTGQRHPSKEGPLVRGGAGR